MSRTGNCMEGKGLRKLTLLFAVVVAVCYSWQTALGQTESVGGPSGSAGAPQSTTGETVGVEGDSGVGGALGGAITNGIPDLFTRRLLFRFSLGESYSTGISDNTRTNGEDFSTVASGSVSYNWRGKRSTYGLNYTAAAHRYHRYRGTGAAVRHTAGVSQTIQLGPRTTWGFKHYFSLTPDFSDELLGDDLAQGFSFGNPLPGFGTVDPLTNPYSLPTAINTNPTLDPLPDLGTASPAFIGSPLGSVPFRSFRVSNSSSAQVAHALSAKTSLSFGASYNRSRFGDGDFFGRDQIGMSASVGRMLSEKTSIGFSYFGSRLEQPGGFDLTWIQGSRVTLSRQLSPGIQVSMGYGPVWVRSSGQEAIPLSPVLANLLGTPSLFRDSRVSFLSWGWNGTTGFSKRWERTHFGIGYGRGVSALNGLSSLSKSDSLSLTLGRQIGRRLVNISGSASYIRHDFIALRDVGRFDQAAGTINLSRPITSAMDFSIYGRYSRVLTTTQLTEYEGLASFGVRFVFHFPRVSVE